MEDLPGKLSTLAESLTLALDRLPSTRNLEPGEEVSPFSVKNELLLSHLQNLVLILILQIRSVLSHFLTSQSSGKCTHPKHDAVVQSLVAIRIYFEKGVGPLESRLKYQIVRLLEQAKDVLIGARRTEDRRTSILARQVKNGISKSPRSSEATLSHHLSASSIRAPRRPPKNALSNAPPAHIAVSFAPPSSNEQIPLPDQESVKLDYSTAEDDAPVAKPRTGSYEEGDSPRHNGNRKRMVDGVDSWPGGGPVNGSGFAGGGAKRVRREIEVLGDNVAIRMRGRYYIDE